uniref:Uncharacterized protein n=1 Tax=Meloidogyne enterolobii TaxID=390850 RepID=A0A6V7UUT7_MELEN|nr:unnamed protein product [Meloidogyne enterolobii]
MDTMFIINPIIVENNSIVYVILHKYTAKYKILAKSEEKDFDKIINLFKNPFRIVQFFCETRSSEKCNVIIKCRNEKNEQNKFELENCNKNEIRTINSRRKYKSGCKRIKMCPENKYTLYKVGLLKIKNKKNPC